MNFRRISSTWKGRREHNSDLEVWRLLKHTRAARLYWKNNRDAGLFRCKRCLGLLSRWLRTAATPKPGASSQQTPKCRAVCRPRRQALPAAQHPVPFRSYCPQAERIVRYSFRPRRLHRASDCPGLPPPDRARIPQDHRARLCHSLQLRISTSWSLCPHLPGAVQNRRPPPPLGRSARLPGPATSPGTHRYSGTPKPGEELDPGGGGRLAKFLQVAPRARREPANLYVTLCPGQAKAHSTARAHTFTHTQSHVYTHSHTSTHPLTHIAHRTGLRTSARSIISWGSTVKLTLLNFLRLFLKFPCYLFFPSQCLPPTPTSRTNLWNPCRVPPVTHNACSSHGQHRRPPKILMFGDPLC